MDVGRVLVAAPTPSRTLASSALTTLSQAPVFDRAAAQRAAESCVVVQKCVQRAPCRSAMRLSAAGFSIIWTRYSSGSMKPLALPSARAAP